MTIQLRRVSTGGTVTPRVVRALQSRNGWRDAAVVLTAYGVTKVVAGLILFAIVTLNSSFEISYRQAHGRWLSTLSTAPPLTLMLAGIAAALMLLAVGIVSALTRRWVAVSFALVIAFHFPYPRGIWYTFGEVSYQPLEWWEIINGLSAARAQVALFHLGEQSLVALCLVAISWLVSSLQAARREATRLATTDALTGLPNRRQFVEALAREVKLGVTPLCVAYLDLDGFKQLNDGAGHEAGDAALVLVAESLRASIRKADVAARLGGDEFAILFRADAPVARSRMEQVRSDIQARASGQGWRLGASIGVVVAGSANAVGATALPTVDRLLSQADSLMYAVKRAGRNAVHVAAFSEVAQAVDRPRPFS